ncbi:hypothetical protein ABT247_25655 [Kitasatospora sp. NPDC001539]|uniref:hypothetical protein n=1 Tax=Kitasatospora sp. NPDC001539 TaxID=3154384 RepID=UPI00332F2034
MISIGPQLGKRPVEPQLADALPAGMTAEQAIVTHRRLPLLTPGSASFVNHRDPKSAQAPPGARRPRSTRRRSRC